MATSTADGAQLKGTVEAPVQPVPVGPQSFGYTRTRVATRAAGRGVKRMDLAIFLTAKESGVIPPPAEPAKISLVGLAFSPTIAACVFEGKVAFENDDLKPLTVTIGSESLGMIPPGETRVFTCTGDPGVRPVRVKEWPHMRAGVYVGTVGLLTSVPETGAFSMAVPTGKYELAVVAESGVLLTQAVEVGKAEIDLGKLVPAGGQATAPVAAAPAGAAEPKASAEAAPKRAAEDDGAKPEPKAPVEPKPPKEPAKPPKDPPKPSEKKSEAASPKPAKKPVEAADGQELDFGAQ